MKNKINMLFKKVSKYTIGTKIKVIIIISMIAAIAWTLTSPQINSIKLYANNNFFESDFTLICNDEQISFDDVSDIEKGETLILTNVIPEISMDTILMFYTKDVEAKVYVDDVLIYTFEMQEGFEFLKTPGNKWNVVDISEQMSGQTLTIELTSNFNNRFESTIAGIYLVPDGEALNVILRSDGFRIIMAFILFAMAIFVYVNAMIWKRKSIKKYFYAVANLYLCTSLWLIAMFNGFDLFFHKPILSYMISMLMASFIPITVFILIKTEYKKDLKILKPLQLLTWGIFALQLILQFVFSVSFLDTLVLTYFVYAFGGGVSAILVAQHILIHKSKSRFSLVTLLIILVGAIGEIVILVLLPERTDLIGVCSIMGMIIYLIVNHFGILFYEANNDLEKLEIEKNYNKLQNTTLMGQIKAHFFFNTLNTISSLCKYDAQQADEAILVFAQYMRSYMRLINEHENINFEQELTIVEASLKIEEMRFPDSFTYEIDLGVTDFKIPPLSIQPIVENSMVHGLRKIDKIGKITVKTRKKDNYIKIIVSDNGVGFDVTTLKDSKNIGLKNLEKRLNLMANGSIEIQSEYYKGTTTTITIPCDM